VRDEHAMFHLINAARERGTYLLLTARSGPTEWGLRTQDLLSRLRLAPEVKIDGPDDALLNAVLFKLFIDRQLVIDTTMITFIQSRIERSIAAARDLSSVSTGRDWRAASRPQKRLRPDY